MKELDYSDVKSARQAARLTQKAMAEYFGIPIRTVSDWERDLRKPPSWVCQLLVSALETLAKKSEG